MVNNRSWWPIIIDHMRKLFTCHGCCNDALNMKFGFQSDERMGYRLEVCKIIARKDIASIE